MVRGLELWAGYTPIVSRCRAWRRRYIYDGPVKRANGHRTASRLKYPARAPVQPPHSSHLLSSALSSKAPFRSADLYLLVIERTPVDTLIPLNVATQSFC